MRYLGLTGKYKTEFVQGFLTTYEPMTDIGRTLYRGELFEGKELDIASKFIKNNSIILDIGANIGLHSLKFSVLAKDGVVIACEPQPKTFKILEKNISQNNIKNIIPLNLAISNKAEISEFFVMSDDAYSSLIDTGRKTLNEKIKVLCTTLDGLLGNIRVDFIKIDVEGLELSVLYSTTSLINQYHPVIFCEIYKGKIDTYNPHDTIAFIRNKGYVAYRVVNGELTEFGLDSLHDDIYYNYFFFPLETQFTGFDAQL
jgi:FkbM family methyltransferase